MVEADKAYFLELMEVFQMKNNNEIKNLLSAKFKVCECTYDGEIIPDVLLVMDEGGYQFLYRIDADWVEDKETCEIVAESIDYLLSDDYWKMEAKRRADNFRLAVNARF